MAANDLWNGWTASGSPAPSLANGVLSITGAAGDAGRYRRYFYAKGGDRVRIEVFGRASAGLLHVWCDLVGTGLMQDVDVVSPDPQRYVVDFVIPLSFDDVRLMAGVGLYSSGTLASAGDFWLPTIWVNGAPILSYAAYNGVAQGPGDTCSVFTQGVEALKFDGSQRILIGGSSTLSVGSNSPKVQLTGSNSAATSVGITRLEDSGNSGFIRFAKSRSAVAGAFVATQTGDDFGQLDFYGDTGSAFARAGLIRVEQDGAVSGGIVPGRLFVNLSGTDGADIERLRILSTGAITHRGNASTIVDANSHLRLRSYTKATLPSASPAGQIIYVSDDVGGATPAFSDGTSWRRYADRNVVA